MQNSIPHGFPRESTPRLSLGSCRITHLANMKTSFVLCSVLAGANAFLPVAPVLSTRAAIASTSSATQQPMRMALNPELAANFPRDFANVSCFLSRDFRLSTHFPHAWCAATSPQSSSRPGGLSSNRHLLVLGASQAKFCLACMCGRPCYASLCCLASVRTT